MKRILRVLLPVGILAVGILGARGLIGLRPEVKPASTEIAHPIVEVVEARTAPARLDVRAQGTVVPRTESRLVSEVSGSVLEVSPHWVNGGFFEEGELLLRVDETDYLLAEREAELRVAQARLILAQEEADADIARADWESERGEEPPPDLVVREPQLAEARAALAAARSALERAQRDLERCRVIAPYPGRVRSKRADVGQFVQRGAELGTVYAVDYAEVRIPLPDAELAFLELPLSYRGEEEGARAWIGPEVTLHVQFAGQEYEWPGHIVRTEGELDPRSRMVIAVAQVNDPYGRSEILDRPPLAIGMFVEAVISGKAIEDAIALPRPALRTEGRIFVLTGEDQLSIREVDVLRAERARLLIRGGLEAGERVIVSPLEEAVDGMTVRPIPVEEQP